jgi:hypothetical protein
VWYHPVNSYSKLQLPSPLQNFWCGVILLLHPSTFSSGQQRNEKMRTVCYSSHTAPSGDIQRYSSILMAPTLPMLLPFSLQSPHSMSLLSKFNCCLCPCGETLSLSCSHQQASCLCSRWYMNMESYGGMILAVENWRTVRKTCPSAILSTINPTWAWTRASTEAGDWLPVPWHWPSEVKCHMFYLWYSVVPLRVWIPV